MGLWSNTFDRARMVKPRKEDDLTKLIEEFFSHQKEVSSFVIVDNKEWVVDVEGSVHLDQNDLYDGELWFTIGKLSGNLYFNGQHFKPSVIPTELGGEVIILRDEEELAKSKGQKGNSDEEDEDLNMSLLTKKEITTEEIISNLKSSIGETISSKNGIDIDIQEILDMVKKDWESKEKYNLIIDFPKNQSYNVHCDIYVHEDDYNVPEGMEKKPLKLNAIQKAYYLMVILNKDGIPVKEDISAKNWKLVQQIYSKLPGRVEKTYITNKSTKKTENYKLGVSKNMFKPNTFKGYFSEIRKILHERIPYQSIVNEFAIEGYKGEPFKIRRATDEMRAEIREKFGLD